MNGLLLINLGTPEAPTTSAVRRYLREFLSDPRVIDIHPIARALLLNLVILPTRPRKSAHAYQKVWTDRGSPLLAYSEDLQAAVAARLGPTWKVVLGMRYGRPSLGDALATLLAAPIERLIVLPLYPQDASASTGSSLELLFKLAGGLPLPPPLSVVPAFYDHPGFIRAIVAQGAPIVAKENPDHVLFSFHGLPERQIKRVVPGGDCLQSERCCDRITAENRSCYRAQCFATARAVASALGLPADRYSITFQSRLGRTPWIRPYTDVVLPELHKQGKRRVVVFCPAFVADCLETLEEIGIRARTDWLAMGGESLTLVPSLNASAEWVDAVVDLVKPHAK